MTRLFEEGEKVIKSGGGTNIKPTFNPALPYVFEDTEEDRLTAFNVFVDWAVITKSFRCFTDATGDQVWWDDKQSYCKQGGGRILVCMSLDGPLSDWPNYKINFPVTYTPPEPIKVIMSGERFVLDSTLKGKSFYFHNPTIVFADDERGEKSRYQIEYSVNNFIKEHPNWHTAKLVEG